MRRPADQVIAGDFRGVERVGRDENAAVVIRVVPREHEPASRAGFHGNICSSCASEIGVEEVAPERGAAGRLRNRAWAERRARGETNDVVEAAGKIVGGDFDAIAGKFLLDAGVPGLAGFGLERGIAREARAEAGVLVEAGLNDAFAVKEAITRVAPESAAVAQSQGSADAGHDAGAEGAIGFGARAEIQRDTRMGQIAKIEIAALIVAAKVSNAQERDVGVLDFVLISGRRTDFAQYVAGLRVDAGAVVFALCAGRGEIAKLRSGYGRGIGLRAASERIGGKETL